MKRIFYSIAVMLGCMHADAQQSKTREHTNTLPEQIVHCGFDEYQRERQKENYQANQQGFEQWISGKIAAGKAAKGAQAAIHTLPIIFHIIYNDTDAVGSRSNIAASQVYEQIRQLNADYGNLSGSRYPQAANTTLQFAPALRDPQGNIIAEPGIDRINRNLRGFNGSPYVISYIDTVIKSATYWDPRKYVNIWVVLDMTSPLGGTLLGYATFPDSSGVPGLSNNAPETDKVAGVVLWNKGVGSLSSPYNGCGNGNPIARGRTLTHELGHYFGLRHIWGDNSSCAIDDFCGDTPRAKGSTSGCPQENNTCNDITFAGAPVDYPDMVENYMDYTDGVCMNTFTADQKDRMVAVMTNSPRRRELLTSSAGISNNGQVAFVTNTCGTAAVISVSEDSISTACPRYRDIPVNLQVFTAATGAATLTIQTTGTATRGADYDIIGGNTVTFAAGDNSKDIMVRIYDDAITEGAETILLAYTISGTGLTAGNFHQTQEIIISASDQLKPIDQNDIMLLSENFDASTEFPAGWRQQLNNALIVNRWTISPNGGLGTSGNAAHISENYRAPAPGRTNTYNVNSTSIVTLSTPLIDATGLSDMKLSFTWRCKGDTAYGGDRGQLRIEEASHMAGLMPIPNVPDFYKKMNAQTYAIILPAQYNYKQFYIGFEWRNFEGGDEGNPGFTIDDVQITGSGLSIETALSQEAVETMPAGIPIRFVSAGNRKLIAGVGNASDNVSCISGSLADTGNRQATLQTLVGSYLRSKKVVQLRSPLNDTVTAYDLTIYFTREEIAGWPNPSALKILQVKDSVDLSHIVTRQDAKIFSPASVDNQLTTKGYIAYTCRVNGFGKFMLVQPEFSLKVQDANAFAGNIYLYPNPVKDNLSIIANGITSATIQVLNTAGQVVMSLPDVKMGNKYTLNVSQLIPGIYLLKVNSNKGESFIQRWTKE